ncbi:hypothetical protein M0813_19179 [Anaeramoeba flamelloides]|uniref:Uncharacterized protein n=1 Tax=Anaeramoeba flamelloides TaxID=1746091 RepID=A0ABQ8YPI2_9EUKA|nr:hypothetical protein M0813_19179 [Anaeramoeba flamelloides]
MFNYFQKAKLYTAIGKKANSVLGTGNSKTFGTSVTHKQGPFTFIGTAKACKDCKNSNCCCPLATTITTKYGGPLGNYGLTLTSSKVCTFTASTPKIANCANVSLNVSCNKKGSINATLMKDFIAIGIKHNMFAYQGEGHVAFGLGPLLLGTKIQGVYEKKPKFTPLINLAYKNLDLTFSSPNFMNSVHGSLYHKCSDRFEFGATGSLVYEGLKHKFTLGSNIQVDKKTKSALKLKYDSKGVASMGFSMALCPFTKLGLSADVDCFNLQDKKSYSFGFNFSFTD